MIPACPECEAAGGKSRVYNHGSSTTLLGGNFSYRDEEGKQHYHDPNKTKTMYKCSEGHVFYLTTKRPCPTCGPRD